MKNVKCARCVKCGKEYEAVPNLTNCSCGGILDLSLIHISEPTRLKHI